MKRLVSILYSLLLVLPMTAVVIADQVDDQTPADIAADIDWPMYLDPDLGEIAEMRVFDPQLRALWAAALKQPDVETRRHAAEDIGRAHSLGMKDLTQFVPILLAQMDEPKQHPVFVIAACKALMLLEAKQAADSFHRHNLRAGEMGVIRGSSITPKDAKESSGGGIELLLITDPALARWNHEQAKPLWVRRIADVAAPRTVRASAIEAIRIVRHAPAADALRTIVTDRATTDDSLRLAAAQAFAALEVDGHLELARQLADGSSFERVLAAALLKARKGDEVVTLLIKLAADKEPTVASIALQRLLQLDPWLVKPLADGLLKNGDPMVRLHAARALAAQKTPRAIGVLGPHLDDLSPQVRSFIRHQFIVFAADEKLTEAVREQTLALLNGAGWRGIEQACAIVGRLDWEASAPRLMELLPHRRNEVRTAAIVALRRLAIADDAMLGKVLAHATKETDEFLAEKKKAIADTARPFRINDQRDRQLAQMHQFLGMMKYAPAVPLMKRFIPKDSGFWTESRAAAIWALGKIYEDKADGGVVPLLISRLSDIDPNNPEMVGVRRMSAISLGRMKADAGLKALNVFYDMEKQGLHIGGSCRWAIRHMTGKELPGPDPRHIGETGWYISPIRSQEEPGRDGVRQPTSNRAYTP